MCDNLRELLSNNLSDEAASHLVDFFYELALAFESIHLGKIMRYQKSQMELRDELSSQPCSKEKDPKEKLEDPPF